MFAPQTRYCPNCGILLCDVSLTMNHVQSLMCNAECRKAWEIKYARMILGKKETETK